MPPHRSGGSSNGLPTAEENPEVKKKFDVFQLFSQVPAHVVHTRKQAKEQQGSADFVKGWASYRKGYNRTIEHFLGAKAIVGTVSGTTGSRFAEASALPSSGLTLDHRGCTCSMFVILGSLGEERRKEERYLRSSSNGTFRTGNRYQPVSVSRGL